MSKFTITKYEPQYFERWNNFVENSYNGTLFHRLDFLAYHKDKFISNEHHLMIFKGQSLYAVLPLAIFEINGNKVAKSPYGASYGSFVFIDAPNYQASSEIIDLFIDYLKQLKINELYLTPPLSVYSKYHCQTFEFALLERGFKLINIDITSISIIKNKDIFNNLIFAKTRNIIKKAQKLGIVIKQTKQVNDIWLLLQKTYEKFQKTPTHNASEIDFLLKNFSNEIYAYIAYYNQIPVAGTLIFKLNKKVALTFYIFSDSEYKQLQATSLVIYTVMLKERQQGTEIFDFGTSSINMKANPSLFKFKEGFGAKGYFRNTYKLVLK